MFKRLSPLQIWGLAIGLFVLDYFLIASFVGATPAMGVEESTWDFRIAELRAIDVQPQTAVAGVSISRETVSEATSNGASPKVDGGDKTVVSPFARYGLGAQTSENQAFVVSPFSFNHRQ